MHRFCIFSWLSTTNPWYGWVVEASCCYMGWTLAERGGRCSWSVAKKARSMYPYRRWSLWTFAVMLLAWHSICHTAQIVLFRTTNANPQTAFFQSHQRLEERNLCNIPSVRWKSCALYKVYLKIGARQRYTYNGRLIENRIWHIKWQEWRCKVIHRLQPFSNAICRIFVQHFTRLQLTVCSRSLCVSWASCMNRETTDKRMVYAKNTESW